MWNFSLMRGTKMGWVKEIEVTKYMLNLSKIKVLSLHWL